MLKFDCNLIREAREKTGMYQKDVAVRAGVKRKTLCEWENGKIVPNAKHLAALATVLNVPVESFFRHTL